MLEPCVSPAYSSLLSTSISSYSLLRNDGLPGFITAYGVAAGTVEVVVGVVIFTGDDEMARLVRNPGSAFVRF